MLRVTCPSCRANMHLSDEFAGKTIRCKQCREVFKVGALPKAAESQPAERRPTLRPEEAVPQASKELLLQLGPPALKPIKSAPSHAPRPSETPPKRRFSTVPHAWLIGGGVVAALLLVGLG